MATVEIQTIFGVTIIQSGLTDVEADTMVRHFEHGTPVVFTSNKGRATYMNPSTVVNVAVAKEES